MMMIEECKRTHKIMKTPSMAEIKGKKEGKMPSLEEVPTMDNKKVFQYLTRIRKSMFKGKTVEVIMQEQNITQARQYLEQLIVRHNANNELRNLEVQLSFKPGSPLKVPERLVSVCDLPKVESEPEEQKDAIEVMLVV